MQNQELKRYETIKEEDSKKKENHSMTRVREDSLSSLDHID